MKTAFAFLLLLVVGNTVVDAATINWTNTAGGNWSVAANWSPNQVPGSSDDAVVTANGSYTVTLDTGPTLHSLTLGGSSGQQTLTTANNILTLNNTSVVNANGVLTLNGGGFSDVGPLTVNGQLNWTNGLIGSGSILTVATNGLILLAGVNGQDYQLWGTLTNAGTIRLVSGNLQLVTYNGGANGELINLPGALVDMQADGSIDSGNYTGPGLVVNQGTVRKSGGTGTSTINPTLNNSGTLDAQSGTVSLNGGGSGNGVFEADAGATLKIVGGYTVNSGSQFTGAGTNSLTGGTLVTLNGMVTSSNAVLAGASLAGTNGVIVGALSWTSGNIATGSTLTTATNGTLVLAGINGSEYGLWGTLTNTGTIRLVSGNLQLVTYNGGANGELINLPGALVDMQADGSIDSGNYTGPGLIVNQGTVRKSGGTGISTINPTLNNSGTLDAQSGTVSLNGSYTLTSGTLNFGISSLASFGKINLSGSAALTGTVSANLNNGYVPVTNNLFTVLTYGSFTGIFTNTALPTAVVWQTNYGPASFSISVISINMLAFTTQPVGGVLTNKIMAPVVVQVENGAGNPIATNGVPVTLSLNSGSGTLSGTLVQNTDPIGKATFSDLSINLIGTKTLGASSSGLATATSAAFAIVPLIGMQWTNGGFELQLNGSNSPSSTIIYASTNLVFWTPIYTNAPTNGAIIFLDPASTNLPHRFYRFLQE